LTDVTLEQAQAHLDAWLAADLAVSTGQSYSIATRALTRVNAAEIRAQIDYWTGKVNALTSGGRGSGIRVRGVW
jgi:hypothetical protein